VKLNDLQEARYYRHPVLTWIDDQMSIGVAEPDSISDSVTLTPDEYETLRKTLPREFGQPKERQDGMHWVLKKKDKRFYLDLQKLFGPPEDLSRRLSISSI